MAATVAQDAPVTGRVIEAHREQGEFGACTGRQKGAGGGFLNERGVAIQDQGGVGCVIENRKRLLNRVPGAELGHLTHELQLAALCGRLNQLGAMAGDDDACCAIQRRHGVQHVLQQGLVGQFVQHLGQGRLHPSALAGRHHHHVQRHVRPRLRKAGDYLDSGGWCPPPAHGS